MSTWRIENSQLLFGSFSGSSSLFILIYIQGEVFVISNELIVFAVLFGEAGCSALTEFANSAVLHSLRKKCRDLKFVIRHSRKQLEICFFFFLRFIISAVCFYNNLVLSMFRYFYWKNKTQILIKCLILQDSWITMYITILFFFT